MCGCKYGQIGHKEKVVEEFDRARFMVSLEDGSVGDSARLMGHLELDGLALCPIVLLVSHHFRLGLSTGHGFPIEGRGGPRNMFPADEGIVGLSPAENVGKLHGCNKRLEL